MNKNKGFSLIELIVVIAIMAILVGIIAPNMIKYVEKAKRSVDANNAKEWIEAANKVLIEYDVQWWGKDPYGNMNEAISLSWDKNWKPSNTDTYSSGMTDVKSLVYRELGSVFLSKTYPDGYIYIMRNKLNESGPNVYDGNTIGKMYLLKESCAPPEVEKKGIELYPDPSEFLKGKSFSKK